LKEKIDLLKNQLKKKLNLPLMGCLKLTYEPVLKVITRTEQNTLSREGKSRAGLYKYKFNGFELQDELGLNWYDYKARNYDPALGRWMNIDPLAETSRRYSPYTYCLNNPIYYIDPDGMQADDWKDKNGKTLNQDQLNKVKVYIFYNPKESGEDGGFGEQTMKQYADYEKKYGKGSVAISDAMTEKDFAQDWGDISGTPNLIAMNHHGTNQALHLDVDPDGNPETKDGEYIVSTNDGKTNGSGTQGTKISDLPETKGDISNTVLKLNTCNSNNPSSSTMTPGTTLAKGFSRDTDVGVVRGTNKKVNFDSNGNPQPQWYYGGGWQFFKDGAQLSTSQVRDLKPN
jgi:RHS repeat-associated protein